MLLLREPFARASCASGAAPGLLFSSLVVLLLGWGVLTNRGAAGCGCYSSWRGGYSFGARRAPKKKQERSRRAPRIRVRRSDDAYKGTAHHLPSRTHLPATKPLKCSPQAQTQQQTNDKKQPALLPRARPHNYFKPTKNKPPFKKTYLEQYLLSNNNPINLSTIPTGINTNKKQRGRRPTTTKNIPGHKQKTQHKKPTKQQTNTTHLQKHTKINIIKMCINNLQSSTTARTRSSH
jgi:hypothetical protein